MPPTDAAAPARNPAPLWLVIACVGVIVGVSVGRSQSMGLFLPHVTTALDVGRESFSFALALNMLLVGFGAPFAGALIDKYGAGRIIVFCVLSVVAGLWMMYAARTPFDLALSGILQGIGVSGTGVTSLVGVVGRAAPPEKRQQAIASVGMAGGIGGFVSLPVMHLLIEWLGWQGATLCLMAACAMLILCAVPIWHPAPPRAGAIREQTLKEALAEAFAHPSYWLLVAGFFVCGFHVTFIAVHLPSFVMDRGLPSWVGPAALSVVGIANIAGTWIAGRSGRWMEKRQALTFIYAGRALIFVGFLMLPPSPAIIIALSGLLGLLWLATVPLTSSLVATFFGTTWMSMLFGVVYLSHQLGSFTGAWLGGKVFDVTKSYDLMWVISIGLGLISAALNWPIKERPVARLARSGA